MDEDNSGEIEFPEFLKVLQNQKAALATKEDEDDTIGAFVALGGNADKTGAGGVHAVTHASQHAPRPRPPGASAGFILADRLRNTVRDFGLTIDIERLIREADEDGSGEISYPEFKRMLAPST